MVYYGDIEQVKKVLADNHITVVISYMMVLDEASSSAQLNLVKTAAKCDTVQRFIMGDLDSFTNCKFSVKDFGFSDSQTVKLFVALVSHIGGIAISSPQARYSALVRLLLRSFSTVP